MAFQLAGKASASFDRMFESADSRLRGMGQNISKLRADVRELERAHKAGSITAEEYARSHARLTRELNQAERAQTRLARATNLSQRAEDFQGRMRGGLMGAMGMAMAVAAPVHAAMQFESAMADVRKVVDFDSPEQFKAMEKDILALSRRIPMTVEGLAEIAAAGGQAGIHRDELVAYAESAAKMGVAFGVSADEAGQTMAQWRAAFKMNQEQVNTLADQINLLGNTTAASAPKISEVVRRIGPLGEVGGAAASSIAALGATMVSAGISEEIAGTGIKNLILTMTAGTAATKKQAQAFKSLGLDAKTMAKAMQEDAEGTIIMLMQKLQQLPKHAQAATLTQLVGRESIAAIAPLLTNLEALEENLAKVNDETQYGGSVSKEFAARASTTANALILLRNNARSLGITIGSVLLPHLGAASEKASALADKVAKWAEKNPEQTKRLVTYAAGALAFGVAFRVLGYAVSLVFSPLAKFYALAVRVQLASRIAAAGTKTWAIAQKMLNLAMSTNPIGLVIKGIAALIIVGAYLYNNFESIRNIVDSVWGAFQDRFPSAARLIETVGQKVGWLWSKLKGFWRWLTGKGGGEGKAVGMGDLRMAGYATGGFARQPQIATLAERGPEAIIPLDGSRRAESLWSKAGQIMGVDGGRGGDINVTFAPTINAPGGDAGTIQRELKAAQNDFMAQFKVLMHQEERLSYA